MDSTPLAEMKFETAFAELEGIVRNMEGGTLELEASIAAYKRGMDILQHCRQQLAVAETTLQMLENGQRRDLDLDTDRPTVSGAL